ncbi:hypothetical protein B0H99_103299 [Planomicrobium soli]|uniref:Uncharacterized protein n=1 Tax=Planomicrobium soli TaxID=1176648 RepID=A0A2P8H4N7_9BACL|nr:hypothetical protein [Planomicrobium soli]PSL41163.1 hypothetical protein B0H99_103299 [Planomicrobium soli]
MANHRVKDYFYLIILGVLILIVFSLITILYTRDVLHISEEIQATFSGGIFTLIGAAIGASLAGIFTLNSVNKQISHSEEVLEKNRKADNDNALMIIDYVLEELISIFPFVSSAFALEPTFSESLVIAVDQFHDPVINIEKAVLDTSLLSNISPDYIEEVPGEIRRNISHLKNVIQAVKLNDGYCDMDNIYANLNRINDNLIEIRKNIKEVIKQ